MTANGCMYSFEGDKNVLELDTDNGCATLIVQYIWNCTIKKVGFFFFLIPELFVLWNRKLGRKVLT